MPGVNKREAAYTEARAELLREMLRGGVFELGEHERGEHVARIVRVLERKYPDLEPQMVRRLVGEGMQRTYGDATLQEAARKGREAA